MLVPGLPSCVPEHVTAARWTSDSSLIKRGECGLLGSSSEMKPDILSSERC